MGSCCEAAGQPPPQLAAGSTASYAVLWNATMAAALHVMWHLRVRRGQGTHVPTPKAKAQRWAARRLGDGVTV